VDATLDVELLLELRAGLRVVDAGDEVVDPLFDGAVHLVESRVGLLERDRRVTGCSHRGHQIELSATASVQDASQLPGAQNYTTGFYLNRDGYPGIVLIIVRTSAEIEWDS